MDTYAEIAELMIDKYVSRLQQQLHVSNRAMAFIINNLAKDYEIRDRAEEYIRERGNGHKDGKDA